MSTQQQIRNNRGTEMQAPTWWVVLCKELAELWIGGKALTLILIYSLLLGIWSYVLASNSELSLIPPKEMVFEMLKAYIAVTLFISLIIGADSISGERERATLEGLLLTPTSRWQLVAGKFLAAISPWPVAFVITIPYWNVLAQGDEVLRQAILWGAILGGILTPALAAIGMLVSLWTNSNKTSMFVSLGIYLFLLLPTQLPGRAQTGSIGSLLQLVNPLAAATHFPAKILVNNRTLPEMWPWLVSPVVLAALAISLLFVSSRELHLEAAFPRWFSRSMRQLLGGSLTIAVSLVGTLIPSFSWAQAMTSPDPTAHIQISINQDSVKVKAGDPVLYNTVVTNVGTLPTTPLTVAMNIINLDAKGDIVDPEDWSPQRTQYLEPLAPNDSTELDWRVNAILDGDYMVYMVAIPIPDKEDDTSQPIASSGIHLTVTPFTRLNPAGVLPYTIGGPVILLLIIVYIYWRRNRQVEPQAT